MTVYLDIKRNNTLIVRPKVSKSDKETNSIYRYMVQGDSQEGRALIREACTENINQDKVKELDSLYKELVSINQKISILTNQIKAEFINESKPVIDQIVYNNPELFL